MYISNIMDQRMNMAVTSRWMCVFGVRVRVRVRACVCVCIYACAPSPKLQACGYGARGVGKISYWRTETKHGASFEQSGLLIGIFIFHNVNLKNRSPS